LATAKGLKVRGGVSFQESGESEASEMGNQDRLWKVPPRVLARVHSKDASNLSIWNLYFHPNPLLRWMFWERLGAVMKHCRELACQSVLDVGCGGGELLLSLSKAFPRVVGLDIQIKNARALANYYRWHNVDLWEGDFLDLPCKEEYFDLVIGCDVLEHQEKLSPFVEKVVSVLKPGGSIIATVPNENFIYRLGRMLSGTCSTADHYNRPEVIFHELKGCLNDDLIFNIPFCWMPVFKLIKCRK
jgi:SAM-dependent methyltransferase